jgi:hypothetical protein
MATNDEKEEITGRVKVDNLQADKETVKDLTGSEQKEIKGGAGVLKRKADPDEGGE